MLLVYLINFEDKEYGRGTRSSPADISCIRYLNENNKVHVAKL